MTAIRFTLLQTNLHWEDKEANLQMLETKIKSVKGQTEIVVLPEMFSTGFSMKPASLAENMDGYAMEWMKRVAEENRVILAGSLMVEEDGKYYNRLIWMQPNRQYGYYDKRHLFGFGGEDLHYTAGNRRLIASVKGWKINLQICYDLRFPVWARQQLYKTGQAPAPEYDLLIYVANWPERRSHIWKSLLVARAIENQSYVIGVNRVGYDGNEIYHSGDSMVVDPLGEIIYNKKDEEDSFTISLKREDLLEIREKYPFLGDGDAFYISQESDLR